MTEGTLTGDALIGTTLDERFLVLSLISRGGLSVLYKGVDQSSGDSVTIRVLTNCRSDDEQSISRFKNAVKLANKVRHPNVVAIVSSGMTPEGAPYLVLPYIDGRSVRERVEKEGPLSLADAMPILRDVGAALQCAHEHGVIHRNLKPSNILLTNVGGQQRAMLTGFGIAKRAPGSPASGSSMSQTSKVVGSPLYMSPEQFINSTIDARSDIYSFGCVIHQMLSGKPPFEAPSLVQLMTAHHHECRPHFAPELQIAPIIDQILDAATLKLPANRYGSVDKLIQDLENQECSVDLKEARKQEPTNPEEQAARQATIRSAAAITAGGVLFVALIIFIASFDSLSHSRSNSAIPGLASDKGAEPLGNKQNLKLLVETGQYVDAIGILKNQLMLAQAGAQPTENIHERLGALYILNREPGTARKHYKDAIGLRRSGSNFGHQITDDYACIATTFIDDAPDQARKLVLELPEKDLAFSKPGRFATLKLAQQSHDPAQSQALFERVPNEFRHGRDAVQNADMEEYLIRFATGAEH